jgi:hypothetical protein
LKTTQALQIIPSQFANCAFVCLVLQRSAGFAKIRAAIIAGSAKFLRRNRAKLAQPHPKA